MIYPKTYSENVNTVFQNKKKVANDDNYSQTDLHLVPRPRSS